jgi:hypothetical protein
MFLFRRVRSSPIAQHATMPVGRQLLAEYADVGLQNCDPPQRLTFPTFFIFRTQVFTCFTVLDNTVLSDAS